MDEQFIKDYEAPITFYKLLENRWKENPYFLRRCLQIDKKKDKNTQVNFSEVLDIVVTGVCPPKSGQLIGCVISISDDKQTPLSYDIISADETKVSQNDSIQWNSSLNIPKDIHSSKRILLFILLFQSLSTVDINKNKLFDIVKVKLDKYFSRNLESCQICLMELLPKVSKYQDPFSLPMMFNDKTRIHKSKSHIPSSPLKPFLVPLSSQSQLVTLTSNKAKFSSATQSPSNPASEFGRHRNDLFAEVKVSWRKSVHTNNSNDSVVSKKVIRAPYSPLDAFNLPILKSPESTNSVVSLYYHYVFFDKISKKCKSLIEHRKHIACPWCNCSILSNHNEFQLEIDTSRVFKKGKPVLTSNSSSVIEVLIKHLELNHFHFQYRKEQDPNGNIHVVIIRDNKNDFDDEEILSSRHENYEFLKENYRKVYPYVCLPLNTDMNLQSKYLEDSLEYNKPLPSNKRKIKSSQLAGNRPMKSTSAVRQYYHARLGVPIFDSDANIDGDKDVDISWEIQASSNAIDEFEDVSNEEKEFMKMWNAFILVNPPYSDAYVSLMCEKFARVNLTEIVSKNLRHNLLLHLFTLWDFSLISGEDIQKVIFIVDKYAVSINNKGNSN